MSESGKKKRDWASDSAKNVRWSSNSKKREMDRKRAMEMEEGPVSWCKN